MPALSLEFEDRTLAPWQAACADILGHAPQRVRGDGGPQLVFTPDDTPMYRLAVANIRVFAHAKVRAHIQRLGYAWSDDGTITTVPTPLSLRARMRSLGFASAGYTPELHRIGDLYMSKRTWLSRQCAGVVPVTVGTAAYYRRVAVRTRLPATRHWREHLRYHLYGVQHDMTRHALMLHLVPASAVRELGSRVQAAVDAAPGLLVPEPLARFYENDLTGYCQAIWRDLATPSAFAPTFDRPGNRAQLHAALDARIAETQKPWWHRVRDPLAPSPSFTIEPLPSAAALRR